MIATFTRGILFSIFITVFSLLCATTAFAQNEAGIGIRPSIIDDVVEPGSTFSKTFYISNVGSYDDTFYLYVRDIIDTDAGGTPIYATETSEPTGYELSQWASLSESQLSIPAQGEAQVTLTITAPLDVGPGNRFGGLFVSRQPPEFDAIGASVGYEVGTIISLRLPGEVAERGVIRSFATANYLYGKLDVEFIARIENTGNTLIRPRGPLQVENMFGKRVADLIFNDSQAGIFPGKTREFTLDWQDENPGFGRYTAQLSLAYGAPGQQQTMSNTLTFWVLPMQIILPALGVLAVLLLVVFVAVRIYVRQKLRVMVGVSSRRISRQSRNAPPILLITLIAMLVTITLFLLVLLVLFA